MPQTCLAHLLRRCREMILVAGGGAREFPRSVQEILQRALQLRDRRDRGQISERGVAVARGRLEARLDQSLQHRFRSPQNRRLANHLLRERDALFTFLNCPGLEATNWRAEQAIRARCGAETELSAEHAPKVSWSAFCKPVDSNSAPSPLSSKT